MFTFRSTALLSPEMSSIDPTPAYPEGIVHVHPSKHSYPDPINMSPLELSSSMIRGEDRQPQRRIISTIFTQCKAKQPPTPAKSICPCSLAMLPPVLRRFAKCQDYYRVRKEKISCRVVYAVGGGGGGEDCEGLPKLNLSLRVGARARGVGGAGEGVLLTFGAESGRGLRPPLIPAESGRGRRTFAGAVPAGMLPADREGAGETEMVEDGAGDDEALGAGELRTVQGGRVGFGGVLRIALSLWGETLKPTIFRLGLPPAPDLSFLAGDPSELGVLSGAERLGGGIVASTAAVLVEGLAAPPVKLNLSGCADGAPTTTGFGALSWRMTLGCVRTLAFSLNTNLPWLTSQ